jgi:hypothetical protein
MKQHFTKTSMDVGSLCVQGVAPRCTVLQIILSSITSQLSKTPVKALFLGGGFSGVSAGLVKAQGFPA